MKKRKICCLVLVLALAVLMIPSALAYGTTRESASAPTAQTTQDEFMGGRLIIDEEGTYTLTGSMKGMIYVDPGVGGVTLVLDNVSVDGGDYAGIVAMSGDYLTIRTQPDSMNYVSNGANDKLYGAAIYTKVPTTFEGQGRLDIAGNSGYGVYGGSNLTFKEGTYSIRAEGEAIKADGRFDVIDGVKMYEAPNANMSAPQTIPAPNAEPEKDDGMQMPNETGKAEAPAEKTNELSAQTAPKENAQQQGAKPQQPNANSGNSGSTPPEMPSQGANQSGNAPANGMNPQMPNGYENNNSGIQGTATSPSEIVKSSAENNAASLEADMDNAGTITMSDENSQVKITDSGTYVVTGSSSDGNITVKKGTTGVVLVLDNLDLTSTTGATLSVNKEAQVKIVISGDVTLTDNENPDDENSSDADIADAYDGAGMKFKAGSQVYITGDGTLTINGNAKNGIKCGDESSLIIDGDVTINITAANDGINSNFDVTLLGSNINISAGDDGIHADHILTIGEDGGGPTIVIKNSYEGLEGTIVNIFGGDISVNSSDDAVNAANGDGLYEGELTYAVNMTGGKLTIKSKGDGIDSNGDVNLIGGQASISSASNGGEAGIDYDGQFYVSDNFTLNNQSGVAGPDNMPGMNNPQNGQMPNMPESNNGQQNGNMPEMPQNGNGQQNGNMPEMPQNGNGQQNVNMPEMPQNGNGQQNVNMPEMPQNGNGQQNVNMPDMPRNGSEQPAQGMPNMPRNSNAQPMQQASR